MKIVEVKFDKKRYIDLQLLADEQEDMIDSYLECGTMYVIDDDGVKQNVLLLKSQAEFWK